MQEPRLKMLNDKFAVLMGSIFMNLIHNADQIVSAAIFRDIAFPDRFNMLFSYLVIPRIRIA